MSLDSETSRDSIAADGIDNSLSRESPRPKIDENLACEKCGKRFANEKLKELHVKLHILSHRSPSERNVTIEREILYEEVKKQQEGVPDRKTISVSPRPRRIYRPPSKRVGLTKVRMEDCLRCDACSCIYIDESDYYKHMRNFHEKYNTIIPRTRKRSPTNLRCNPKFDLEQYGVSFCPSLQCARKDNMEVKESKILNMKDNIKNRWSKVVSQRLASPQEIKQEAEDCIDYSPLLCQVEVKIKTEPPDYD